MIAKASYKPTKWEEKQYETISPDMGLSRVSASFAFTGEFEGPASVEYLRFTATLMQRINTPHWQVTSALSALMES
jgi:hypothetical protein